MENSVFEAIYLAVSTLIFIAALSAAVILLGAVQKTADVAIEKVNTLEYGVITRPLDYNQNAGQNESNIVDITIIKGHELIATYVESIKKDWVNKNYEFKIYVENKGYVPLDLNTIKNISVTANYKRVIEPTVKLINYDKGYIIDKIIVKFKQEG